MASPGPVYISLGKKAPMNKKAAVIKQKEGLIRKIIKEHIFFFKKFFFENFTYQFKDIIRSIMHVIFISHLTVCMLSRQENKTIYIELSHFKTAPETDICP